MKTKTEIRDWLLENATNEHGNLDLGNLDFSKFNGNVIISGMEVKNTLYQDSQRVGGHLEQHSHIVGGDLHQDFQTVGGELIQDEESGMLFGEVFDDEEEGEE